MAKDGDKISLRAPGRDKAREILKQVLDPAVPNEWPLGSGPRKRSMKASGTSEGEPGESAKPRSHKGVGRSKKVDSWLTAWKNLGLSVNGYAVLENRSVMDKGIFGLWAIRRAANESGKEISRPLLSRFLWEAFEIKVDERTLEKALLSNNAKGRVSKVRGVTFQILPSGMNYASQIAGLSTTTVAPSEAPV